MKDIIEVYRNTVKENLSSIEKILKSDIGIENPEIIKKMGDVLQMSSDNLVSKWKDSRKYMRTFFVKKAFPEYPEDIIKISVSLDAIINLLDDILDEKMGKNLKSLYIVELIRIISIYNYQNLEKKYSETVGNYFNKIISIAILEDFYKDFIKKENDSKKILDLSIQIYNCRSLDMDIFTEIPLIRLYNKIDDDLLKVIKVSRIFRALNLIKKDIKDAQHDKDNEVETVITLLYDSDDFNNVVNKLIAHYKNTSDKIESDKKDLSTIISNFKEMIKNETSEIQNLL